MQTNHSVSITEKALNLWRESSNYNSPNDAAKVITNEIFHSIKNDRWYGRIISLFSNISKFFIGLDVKKALSAYKFELITSSETIKKTWLFSENEKTCINDKSRHLFQKVLERKNVLTIRKKAKRWDQKVEKYHHNFSFMLASCALEAAHQRFPETKRLINTIIKPMGEKEIKLYAARIFDDPDEEQGLANLLARKDFNPQASTNDLIRAAAFEIGKEKIKTMVYNAKEKVKAITYNTLHPIYSTCSPYIQGACNATAWASRPFLTLYHKRWL